MVELTCIILEPDQQSCTNILVVIQPLKNGAYNFFKSKNIILKSNYTQNFDGRVVDGDTISGGFTYNDYKNEIDNGWPVIIHLKGHTVLGVGYDTSGGKNYAIIHDTWSASMENIFEWGGALPYSSTKSLDMQYVTVIHLTEEPVGGATCIGCGANAPSVPIITSTIFNSSENATKLIWQEGIDNGYDTYYYAIYRCPSNRVISDDDLIAYVEDTQFVDSYNGFIPENGYRYAVASVGYEAESGNTNSVIINISNCNSNSLYGIDIGYDVSYTCDKLYVKNVSVNSGDVEFNVSENFEIVSDFEVECGATLEIK